LDLLAALVLQARRLGIPEGQVYTVGVCTHCDPRLFSHRRDQGKTGRMWGVVLLGGLV
ncbi:MAG: hypothetical protein C4301_09310, partial [Thermus sp.]|uniref:laccase domain-containing protein n=1 Tax=Thermus sp. TaxID=275 RepID=UPI00331B2204